MMTQITQGFPVQVNGLTGKILRVRMDTPDNEPIVTVQLDNPAATPDGLYYARVEEIEFL